MSRLILLPLLAGAPSAFAEDDAATDGKTEDDPPDAKGVDSFGAALDLLGLTVSWSGYGDLVATFTPGAPGGEGVEPRHPAFGFDASHFNPILGVRLGERVYTELELEFEHGGDDILVEYALLDYTLREGIKLRIGKFLVPIGDFNDNLHPSFRWVQATRPAMTRNVVPEVWSDVGVQVFGTAPLGADGAFSYAAYVVNGLGGEIDPESATPIRDLRGNNRDNNIDKALGARVGVDVFRGAYVGQTTISLSGVSGVVDAGGTRWTAADVALALRFGPAWLRAEIAQSFLGVGSEALTPYEHGLYLQPSVRVGRTTLAARWDYVGTGLSHAIETRHSAVASVKYDPTTFWNLRAEVVVPLEAAPAPTLTAMSAFYF